jgi:hypothetical protein
VECRRRVFTGSRPTNTLRPWCCRGKGDWCPIEKYSWSTHGYCRATTIAARWISTTTRLRSGHCRCCCHCVLVECPEFRGDIHFD